MTPKIQIIDNEIWVCVGHCSTSTDRFGIIRQGEWETMRKSVAENERKRIAFLLEHMEEFLDFIQWRGNPKEIGSLLDHTPIKWPE